MNNSFSPNTNGTARNSSENRLKQSFTSKHREYKKLSVFFVFDTENKILSLIKLRNKIMKKNTILAILVTAFFALNISAQSLTTEQKMTPFAVGMSLSVLGEMHDDNYLAALSEYQKNIRYYSAELKPVIELTKDSADYKRMDIAQTATKALRDKSSKSDKWQMLVGERFGTIYVQFKKNKTEDVEINADDLKFSLDMIGVLAGNAPADIPEDVVEGFQELGKMKDLKDISSEANVQRITHKVMEILSKISN